MVRGRVKGRGGKEDRKVQIEKMRIRKPDPVSSSLNMQDGAPPSFIYEPVSTNVTRSMLPTAMETGAWELYLLSTSNRMDFLRRPLYSLFRPSFYLYSTLNGCRCLSLSCCNMVPLNLAPKYRAESSSGVVLFLSFFASTSAAFHVPSMLCQPPLLTLRLTSISNCHVDA